MPVEPAGAHGQQCEKRFHDGTAEVPVLIRDDEKGHQTVYFKTDWVMDHLRRQDCRIDRAEDLARGAFALSVAAVILALLL